MAIHLTPSYLYSIIHCPLILFGFLSPLFASIQPNTGTTGSCPAFLAILFTVRSLNPALISLIRILRYQSFHSSDVALFIALSIASFAALPESTLSAKSEVRDSNSDRVRPGPSSVEIGMSFTPNVIMESKPTLNPHRNSLLVKCSDTTCSLNRRLLSDSNCWIIFQGFVSVIN